MDPDNKHTPERGTFSYMSLEIKTGPDYDFKTDIWYFNNNILLMLKIDKFKILILIIKVNWLCHL